MDRQIWVKGYSCVLALLVASGCTNHLNYNEGATQIAHSLDRVSFSSIFIRPSEGGSDALITKGEAISIKLISAYICDFREGSRTDDWLSKNSNAKAIPCAEGDGSTTKTANYTRGEIAIIANAGERNGSTAGLTFTPTDIKRNGRIVYYNEDVRESGQLINALNIPVYGPKTYEGGPLFMDWAMLELDNDESEQSRQLLQELANIGSVAYAPGTPVFNLLNTLGGALLSANGDDVELRYQMEFDAPYSGKTKRDDQSIYASNVDRAPLKEGYYAIVRRENRNQLPEFSELSIGADNHNPILIKGGAVYTGGTWLLVRVSREDNEQALTQDLSAKTAAFLEMLDGRRPISAAERQQLTESFTELLKMREND